MSILNVGTIQANTISSSTGTTALTIGSSGILTRNQNISFKAFSTAANISYTTTATVVWPLTQHNLGNFYSTSTGRFTAPVTGTYHFGFHTYRQGASGYVRMFITSNSNSPAYLIEPPNASVAVSLNLHCTVRLQANDFVQCELQADASTQFFFAENHSFFYGFLIG
jgi:hypothetical protein